MKLTQILGALTVVASTAVASITHAEELSVATFIPPQHHVNANLFKWFGEELDKRSGGSLTMKLYPAGQLGAGPVQQYKRVVEGVADVTFGLQAYTPKIFPRSMLIIPPGKATSAKESTERMLNVYEEHLAQEYQDVKLLGIFTTSGNIWAATSDVSTMDGIKGKKMVPYAAMTTPIVEALGAVPVQMPVTEMYTGLSTGTIDSTTATYNNITAPWNFWDVSSHLVTNVPVQFAVFFVAMNKERYQDLSDEHRAIIDELAGEVFSLKGAESFDGADARSKEIMQTADQMANITQVVVNDEERAKMNAAVADGMEVIFADYEGRGVENARAIYGAINN
ncbi:TRAP transporter substrate-binding protein [Tropicibacter sp. Alg240-R139]|uniref:TRAP transporter substrate-binding protein n=1 Tax=Tropicibacter sp. Alg240-R139 TaxID=2305991 RepID=UPI0013E01CF9|nr:TRAP transporter substrate-binding protein [Tropicibacter sp. Alg240-R139]